MRQRRAAQPSGQRMRQSKHVGDVSACNIEEERETKDKVSGGGRVNVGRKACDGRGSSMWDASPTNRESPTKKSQRRDIHEEGTTDTRHSLHTL